MNIHKLTLAALLVAIGTLSAHLVYIPAGASKCFPVQHAINVLCAVILGPKEAVSVAFVISCLRNMAGTGSLLAFPGSMIGAFLAGLAYRRWHNTGAAMLGEIFGTGILGGLAAWVIAWAILNSKAAAWFFVPPFLISTMGGSIIAGLLIKSGILTHLMPASFSGRAGKLMDFNLDNFLSQILYVFKRLFIWHFCVALQRAVLAYLSACAAFFASLLQVCILLIAFIAFSAAFFLPVR